MKQMIRLACLFLVLFPAASFSATHIEAPSSLRLGSDRIFESRYLQELQGLRVAVLAHYASRNQAGAHIVDILHGRTDIALKMIFAPEHGFRGVYDDRVPDSVDEATGLPVYSLYGPRRAPTAELLSKVDAVIIDLQDVGVRFYTYAATISYVLEACKKENKKVFLLDRPNPIGGEIIEGAMLENALATGGLTAIAPIPTRHGMTIGELAILLNQVRATFADLTVVPMQGWKRSMLWKETGLPWLAPSPALVAADQAILYGVLGTLESLNLAVGRGVNNQYAFHSYGAPWITKAEAAALASRLEARKLPGLKFRAFSWTPDRSEYFGQLSHGIWVELVDAAQVDGFGTLLEVLTVMRSMFGSRLDLSKSDVMLGATWLRMGLERGLPIAELRARAEREALPFLKMREGALLY